MSVLLTDAHYSPFIVKAPTAIIHPPSRPSPRASNSKKSTIIRKKKSSPPLSLPLPAYTTANPFLYRVSAHSFTHSWPTHKLVSCPRCSGNVRDEQQQYDDDDDDDDESSAEKKKDDLLLLSSSSYQSRSVLVRSRVSASSPSSSCTSSSSPSSLLGYEPDELFDF
ncbi:hypothetical protein VTN96DRAFT_706 [Rasamsonia emersonii]